MTTSLNIRALKDAVARWQTYEDRGIKPRVGWGSGGNGNSCALGDINYYERFNIIEMIGCEAAVSDMVGLDSNNFNCPSHKSQNREFVLPYAYLTKTNDFEGRWPIAEVQRLVEWEEAKNAPLQHMDNSASRDLVDCMG